MTKIFPIVISYRLMNRIIDVFPYSKQVRELGLENAVMTANTENNI